MAEFSSLNGYAVKDNVARSIAKGRNQAVAFTDYASMIETLNEYEKDEFKAGQNIYIGVVGVPDLWVYSVEDIRHTFIYESDEDIAEKLKTNTTIQAGFFKLAMLEGQKVDLTTYDQHLAKHDEDIAKNVNDIVTINESLGGMQFGIDANGNYGYIKAGADTVTPFNNKNAILKGLNGNQSVSIPKGTTSVLLMAVATTQSATPSVSISGSNYVTASCIVSNTIGLPSLSSTMYYFYKITLNGNAGTLNIAINRSHNQGNFSSGYSLIY